MVLPMKFSYRQLIKEPLIQFMAIGLLLFGGERLLNSDDYADSQNNILVDEKVLTQYFWSAAPDAIHNLTAMDPATVPRHLAGVGLKRIIFAQMTAQND